jgi:hypothetical protein
MASLSNLTNPVGPVGIGAIAGPVPEMANFNAGASRKTPAAPDGMGTAVNLRLSPDM